MEILLLCGNGYGGGGGGRRGGPPSRGPPVGEGVREMRREAVSSAFLRVIIGLAVTSTARRER